MYSRFPAPPPFPSGEPSYRRASSIRIPPNYNGSVFAVSEGMPPQSDRQLGNPAGTGAEDPVTPDFRNLPQVRQPTDSSAPTRPPTVSSRDDTGVSGTIRDTSVSDTGQSAPPFTEEYSHPAQPQPRAPEETSPAPFRFPIPPLSGHGIGQEEIIILGLCLLLLYEDSGTDGRHGDGNDLWETLLLLGILFFCG